AAQKYDCTKSLKSRREAKGLVQTSNLYGPHGPATTTQPGLADLIFRKVIEGERQLACHFCA
ncbi:hypothetical protein RRG08_032947, partial [Elysia crispata]